MAGIVQFFARESDEGHRCGYCKGATSCYSKGMWAYVLTPQNYQDLIDRGWRRSGKYCYKPTMNKTCCPQYTIRCDALAFKLKKSHKKLLKRIHRFLMHGGRQEAVGSEPEASGGGLEATASDSHSTEVVSAGNSEADDYATGDTDCRAMDESDLSGRGVGRINDDDNDFLSSGRDITDSRVPDTSLIDSSGENKTSPVIPTDRHKTGDVTPMIERGPCLKKKELRKQRWAQKRKAANLPLEPQPTPKNHEKTLEEWLALPEGKHKLEIRLIRTTPYSAEAQESEDASHHVYTLYQMKVHSCTKDKCKQNEWKQFLIDSPLTPVSNPLLGSFHQQYWLDGRLIAVGVLDLLPSCVSSVYLYYDPEFSFLSLGTFSTLCEIQLVRDLHKKLPSLKYYYMGFYIHSCPKMIYKAKLPNSDILCPETYTWHPISHCLPLIAANKYSRLEPNPEIEDARRPTSIKQASILLNRRGMTVAQYLQRKKVDGEELEEIREYCELVGSTVMKEVYLFRDGD